MKNEELTIGECLEVWLSALEKKDDESYTYTPKYGNKYIKIIREDSHNYRSVHAFVCIETKRVHKAASWVKPSPTSNYHLIDDIEALQRECTFSGSYLYASRKMRIDSGCILQDQ